MRDDEYQRTARALARNTRMSDASTARIEQKLLSAHREGDFRLKSEVHFRLPAEATRGTAWLSPLGGRSLATAAAIVLIAGCIALWMSRTASPVDHIPLQATSAPNDIVLPVAPKAIVPTIARPSPGRRGNRPAPIAESARVVTPNGFVELPWSAGLPAFESGEIVRVEVPVASLPAYGFDVSRGTGRNVEADVLVGQDGLARAMRLVSNSARSTQ